ncbi:MAG: hypothetical protein C0410_08245 [Anaerolinea sp.]|nr:hypothetical protein [Anaerolinea sp.]
MENKQNVEEARNTVIELINACLVKGPQIFLLRGKEIAAVVSINDYKEMSLLKKMPYYFLSPENHQLIKRNEENIAVILPYSDFLELSKKNGTLSSFFRESPLSGIDLRRDHAISPEEITL